MITAISRALTNPTLVNLAQSTDATVATKTTVNSIGRPGFILIDKNISSDTKKFAATKEFLYQATCLAVYMAVIVPIFKKGGFKLAKEKIFQNKEGFEHFKNFSEYTNYRKVADILDIEKRNKKITELSQKGKLTLNDKLKSELEKDAPEKFSNVKGAVDLSNLIGSVVGLSIIAPQVSQALIHPVLRAIGMEKKSENDKKN